MFSVNFFVSDNPKISSYSMPCSIKQDLWLAEAYNTEALSDEGSLSFLLMYIIFLRALSYEEGHVKKRKAIKRIRCWGALFSVWGRGGGVILLNIF